MQAKITQVVYPAVQVGWNEGTFIAFCEDSQGNLWMRCGESPQRAVVNLRAFLAVTLVKSTPRLTAITKEGKVYQNEYYAKKYPTDDCGVLEKVGVYAVNFPDWVPSLDIFQIT